MGTAYPFQCILMSGMPCTGKDTLSLKLIERDPTFVLFRKHKADQKQLRQDDETYISVSVEQFQEMAQQDAFMQYHTRYGRYYGVSREEYARLVQIGKIPIIHVGKYENLRYLRANGLTNGLSLLLWARRDVVRTRLEERHRHRPDGVDERLVAYDEEIKQLKQHAEAGTLDFDLVFTNNGPDSSAAADELLTLLHSCKPGSQEEANDEIRHILTL